MARTPDFPPSSDGKQKKETEPVYASSWTGRGEQPPVEPVPEPYRAEMVDGKLVSITTEDRVSAEAAEAAQAEAEKARQAEELENNRLRRGADLEKREGPVVTEDTFAVPPEPKEYNSSAWTGRGEPAPEEVVLSGKTPVTKARVEPKIPGIENLTLVPKKEKPVLEKRTAPELGSTVPTLEDHFAAVTASSESTPRERLDASRSLLKSLVEKAAGTVGSAPEKFSPKYEKGIAWLAARKETLGEDLKKFGIDFAKNTFEDTKSLGRGALHAVRNPEESVRATAEMAKRIYRYNKSLLSTNLSLAEKGKKLGTDLKALGNAYRKMPQNRKILLSAALAGGSLAFGGGAALVTSVFAAGKYGARALSGLSIYTALEAMGEEKLSAKEIETQEIRSRLASWKKHGIATAAGLALASGVPGALIKDLFIGGEEGVSYLYHAMNGAPAPSALGSLSPMESWDVAHGHTSISELEKAGVDSSPGHGSPYHPSPETMAPSSNAASTTETTPPAEVVPTHAPVEATITKSGQGIDRLFEQLQAKLRAEGFSSENPPPFAKDIFESPDRLSMHYGLEAHDGSTSTTVHVGDSLVLKDGHYVLHTASGEKILSESSLPRVETSNAPVPEVRPEHVFPPAETVEALPSVHEVAPVVPEPAGAGSSTDALGAQGKHDFSGRTGERMPYGKDAGAGAHLPLHSVAESLPSNTEGVITNHFGTHVLTTESHLYQSPDGKQVFAYGGAPEDQNAAIIRYLTEHKNAVVYGTDESGKFRIPYYQGADGKVMPGLPIRTNGIFGFFSNFMKAPGPEELKTLIK